MKQQPQIQALGASETARFFCTQISSAAGAVGELKQPKKGPNMATKKMFSRFPQKSMILMTALQGMWCGALVECCQCDNVAITNVASFQCPALETEK